MQHVAHRESVSSDLISIGSTRTVMSGEVYEIRQKSGETCRGSSQHSAVVDDVDVQPIARLTVDVGEGERM